MTGDEERIRASLYHVFIDAKSQEDRCFRFTVISMRLDNVVVKRLTFAVVMWNTYGWLQEC